MNGSKYPEKFYYPEQSSVASHKSNPPGNFSISRMLKIKPAFESSAITRQNKPKKLILADWRAENWSSKKIQAIQLKLKQLMTGDNHRNECFEVYLWQNGTVIPLSVENLNLLNSMSIRQKLSPCDAEFMLNKAFEHSENLKHEQTMVLDPYHLDSLLEENFNRQPVLTTHEFESLFSQGVDVKKMNQIEEYLASMKPSVIIQNSTSQKSELVLKWLTKQFPNCPCKKNLEYIDSLDQERFDNQTDYVKDIVLNENSISLEQLFSLLDKTPLVKNIELYFNEITDPHYQTLSSTLNRVKTIQLGIAPIPPEALCELINKMTRLKKITLDDYDSINELFEDLSLHLPKLQILDLSMSDIKTDALFKALNKSPKLEELTLSYLMLTDEMPEWDLNALPYLETLYLIDAEISSIAFGKIISRANNLKRLDLLACTHTVGLLNALLDANPTKLESISLCETDVSFEACFNFLRKATSLTTLDLRNCKNLNGPASYDSPIFWCIQSLSLDNSNISPFNLLKLLKSTPHLQKLSLCGETHIDFSQPVFQEILKKIPTVIFEDGYENIENLYHTHIDANTENKNNHYKLNRIFYTTGENETPDISMVRYYIYDTIQINPQRSQINPQRSQINNAFSLLKAHNPKLKACLAQNHHEDVFLIAKEYQEKIEGTCYYGKQTLLLTDDWQPIASLSPNETLTHYHISPEDALVEIQYSTVYNQYFIKSNSGPQSIDLDFSVHVPVQTTPLAPEIQERIAYYLSFGSGKLELDIENPTGEDYLNAMIRQKRGSCLQRAAAFKYEMDIRGIPARIITNECHAFVEIFFNQQWYTINLGGYPAQLTINDSNRPAPPSSATQTSHSTRIIFDGQRFERTLFTTYLDTFTTWEKPSPELSSALEYAAQCLLADTPKRLIECQSDEELHALRTMMQLRAQHTSKPFFVINDPDDLVCAASYLMRNQDNQGMIHKGPGGPLYEFLIKHPDGTLFIDYSRFDADDIVRWNTLLDKPPMIDGVLLPKTINIIALININKPDCYQGADFYSRFEGNIETCPITEAAILAEEPTLARAHQALEETELGESAQEPFQINLFYASDWRERLLGRWILDGEKLYYQEGALAQIEPDQPLEISNGLWDNPEFRQFWIDIQTVGIPHPAGAKDGLDVLPFLLKDNTIQQTEGYDWQALLSHLQLETDKNPEAIVCNPTLLQECLSRHKIEDGLFHKQPGWIEQAQETGVLDLHLTRSLTEDEWAMLLTETQTQGIRIHASFAPGVELPEALTHIEISEAKPPAWQWQTSVANATTQTIISTDINTTVSQMTQENKDWLVFDVSELEPSDLLIGTKANFDEKQCRFHFREKRRLLFKALEKNKNIILKGTFSDELKDSLAPFLYKREQQPDAPGRLVLVTENKKDFNDLSERSYHEVTASEKIQILLGPDEENHEYLGYLRNYLEQESLAKLQARLRYLKTQYAAGAALEDLDSDNAWIGLRTLPQQTDTLDTFEFETSEQAAHDFMQKRFDSVNQALQAGAIVFLSGPTGSGKTTFVEQYIGQSEGRRLFIGEEQLKAWTTDDSEDQKILFIDEANLAHKDWTQLDGLLQHPPTILIGGKPYPLSPQHKVIFAGNPTSYGDERKLPRLFDDNGSALYFEPLPKAVLYENILKPVFKNTSLAPETVEAICSHILNLYDFIKPLSRNEVLISPRELQTMALLIQASGLTTDAHGASSSTPNIDETTIQRIAWQYAKPWVPSKNQQDFDEAFKPEVIPAPGNFYLRNNFIVTPSRQSLVQQMDEWLALRQWRIAQNESLNDAQRYGGLGGFVIEGEPGIGKSDILIQILIYYGFCEAHDIETTAKGNLFYRIPASLSLSEKEALLRKAFDDGAMVIMDEMNSSPMMERLLNSLLMGKTPEGQRPKNPGFFIIGTQNPSTMAGRHVASNALGHRINTTHLENYSQKELVHILKHKGIEPDHAKAMAKAFLTQHHTAILNHYKPEPTFRDLLVHAKHRIKSQQSHHALKQTHPEKTIYSNSQNHTLFGQTPVEENKKQQKPDGSKLGPS